MSLSADEVRQVARLARLELSDDELTRMGDQLNRILGYVELIQKLNTDGVEPLAHPLPVQNVFRPDELRPSLPVDEALRNAPARSGDFFAVPAVLDPADDQSH
jgi:aspartyl-tRNA(Asn)/glutamyl-tRNA(Gln) amidotransferase subunit C